MEKRFWMICSTHMFLEVYLMIQVALIPVYIKEFQLSLLEVSLVATIPSFVQLLMNVPWLLSGSLQRQSDPARGSAPAWSEIL